MLIGSTLARGRHIALVRMRGTCTVDRPGTSTTNADGAVSATFTKIYQGCCYTRYPGLAQESNRDVAGTSVVESRLVVRIPFGVVVRPGDRITITGDPDNPQLVGTVLRAESIDDQSQATAQRILCSDYQAGAA